jgi:hypothetical protein
MHQLKPNCGAKKTRDAVGRHSARLFNKRTPELLHFDHNGSHEIIYFLQLQSRTSTDKQTGQDDKQ